MIARIVALALLVAAVLAGCADAPVAGPRPPVDGRAVDVAYAQAMIPHHQQALELAALVPGRSASPEVADLAFRIDREQVEEVGQLQGLLRLWNAPTGGGMSGMAGMAGPDTLAGLRSTSGPTFDRLWLATMIAHHEGAVTMAREHLTAGADPGLRSFSESVAPTQQAEIERMRTALSGKP